MPLLNDQIRFAREIYEGGKAEYAKLFDPHRELVCLNDAEGDVYSPRWSLAYARCLLLNNSEEDHKLAARIVENVLAVQERQAGNIHEGNWPWMIDDGYVYDLNSVSFVLEELCALMRASSELLPSSIRDAVHRAIALGLREHERIDVGVAYTNIFLLDAHNSILCGQILGQQDRITRGRRLLEHWIAYTGASGSPSEFLSPTYTGFALLSLALIAEYAEDPELQLLALVGEERLWLHVATHYHDPTAQLAGPHSRAYQNDVTGGLNYGKYVLYSVLGDPRLRRKSPFYQHRQLSGNVDVGRCRFHCPEAILGIMRNKPSPFTVQELARGIAEIDTSTELTDDWALGVSSRSYGPQSDNLILYYRKQRGTDFGVAFCRFILNNKRLGSHYQSNTRSHLSNLNDEGDFRGLHYRNKAIGIYGLHPQPVDLSSIRLDFFFAGLAWIEHFYCGSHEVDPASLPIEVSEGESIIVADGDVYVAIRALRHSNLGRRAPIRLEERDGYLVHSTVIYEGPEKPFWEYRTLSGPFFHGNIECGIVVEIASRGEFANAAAFTRHLANAILEEATCEGVRTVRYRSGGDDLLFRYRLDNLSVVERSVNGSPYASRMLRSPLAVQDLDGPLEIGGYRLEAPAGVRWMYVDPTGDTVTATGANEGGGPWKLHMPGGKSIAIDSFGLGRVWYSRNDSELVILCAAPPGHLTLRGWEKAPLVTVNGQKLYGRLLRGTTDDWVFHA